MAPAFSAEDVWRTCYNRVLKDEIQPLTYNTWFAKAVPFYVEDQIFGLAVPNDVVREFIIPHKKTIESALKQVTHILYKLQVVVRPDGTLPETTLDRDYETSNNVISQRGQLNPEYTFDSFIVGSNNEFAHATCISVASMKNPRNNNPLFIYGGSGLGKTHLLHAIGNRVNIDFPGKRVVYVQSEQFVNELIACIQNNDYTAFREHYRLADMLLIDDIQFIEGKERMQVEFFHTFNMLYESGKNVVLTCDKPPQNLTSLEERLRTRLMSGLTADIGPPDYETRLAILGKLQDSFQTNVSEEIVEYIASNITNNVRELEGAFKTIRALYTLGTDVTLDRAKHVLRNLIQPGAMRPLTCEFIMEVVSNYYGVTVDDLKSRKRSQNIVIPRRVAMFLSRKKLGLTYEEIGTAFGGKNHATVMHACDKMNEDLETDFDLQEALEKIEARLQ
ncbi:MAG TPA: chromosomal replication initiator protein DnaA [Fastidiosipila sp.]|jgi:chromosomal replication initiator protein|nr:chromosomal replication initiator protein DnaA [Eubacteriales bacterium]MDD3611430.1 chromosomal replication initiator protein DnaA [Eubacteriales bacterium]HHU03736.1 chromosomal replication initiator protein DnaA [Fastidiosipila sp.]